jgi:hypothetical protein
MCEGIRVRLVRSLAAVLALAVLAGAVAYLALRHRVDARTLGHSVASEAGSVFLDRCGGQGGRWRCDVTDGSGGTTYAVSVDDHCWRGRRIAPNGGERRFPDRLRGCIGFADQVRVLNRL